MLEKQKEAITKLVSYMCLMWASAHYSANKWAKQVLRVEEHNSQFRMDVATIVGLVVTVIIIAALVPTALEQLAGEKLDIDNEAAEGLWELVPFFVVFAIVIGIISMALGYDVISGKNKK